MGKVFPFCMISFFPVVLLIQSVILFKLTPHPLQANCSTMCATKEYGFKYLASRVRETPLHPCSLWSQ